MEDYDKIKKTLAVAFMHDLDANRQEGKMCLSNGECADIEKAFNEQDWSKLARYLDKYTKSEDERIRMELVEYLKGDLDDITTDETDRWINWIEKQKEQKKDIEHIQQSWYMEGYFDKCYGKEPKWIVRTGEGGPKYELNPKYGQDLGKEQKPDTFSEPYNPDEYEVVMEGNATSLKRKGQKPAEKQDYSGLNDCERAIHRGFLCAGISDVSIRIIKETAKDCIAHFPWPTKWSKEDEK